MPTNHQLPAGEKNTVLVLVKKSRAPLKSCTFKNLYHLQNTKQN